MFCRKKKAAIFAIELLDHKPIQLQLNHGTSCNMSPRNIDNITNITLEKCSWKLVIYSICTLSPVSKNKLLIRNLWNKQHYLLESVTAERQRNTLLSHCIAWKRAICSPSAIKNTLNWKREDNSIPVWWGSSTLPAALIKQLKKERAYLQRKCGVTSSETSAARICLPTVVTKFFGELEIGIGSETLKSEE